MYMDRRIENTLREKRHLKEASIRAYKSHFKRLAVFIADIEEKEIKYIKAVKVNEHLPKILEWISTMNHSARVSMYSTILVIFSPRAKRSPMKKYRENYDRVNDILKQTNAKYNEEKQSQNKTEKEDKNWIEWTDIIDFADQFQKTTLAKLKLQDGPQNNWDFSELQRVVILALYTKLPPRRLDYAGMEVIDAKKYKGLKMLDNNIRKHNYLIVKSKTVMFFSYGSEVNKSKLSANEDCVEVAIPRDLAKLLAYWLAYNHTGYLLINAKDAPMTKGGLGKQLSIIFKRQFDKSVGVSLLRKIFLSYAFKDDSSYNAKKLLAQQMNHSVSTQMIHYVKR